MHVIWSNLVIGSHSLVQCLASHCFALLAAEHGLQDLEASEAGAPGLSRSAACGIFLDQKLNPCPLLCSNPDSGPAEVFIMNYPLAQLVRIFYNSGEALVQF